MPFKIKDLMIDVATTADRGVANLYHPCLLPSIFCRYPTVQPCALHTTLCFNLSCAGVSYQTCQFGSITPTVFTPTGCGI